MGISSTESTAKESCSARNIDSGGPSGVAKIKNGDKTGQVQEGGDVGVSNVDL